MSLLRVKSKGQVTIPSDLREQLELEQGDYLEAEVRDGRIVLTPKVVLDRAVVAAIDEGLDDLEADEVEGPFERAAAFEEHVRSTS